MTQIFEDKEEIQQLLARADHDGTTGRIISHFFDLKKERRDFYLEFEELEEILKWKLRGQFGRQQKKRKANTNENIIAITKAAFL